MNNFPKRLLALLVAAVMLFGMLPTAYGSEASTPEATDKYYVYTEADNALLDNDVFASIELVKAAAAQACGGIGHMVEADYKAIVPQVIEAVEASETYIPGTLENRDGFLFWQTTVGIPCCYDPRMEAKLNNTDDDPTEEEIAKAEAEAQALLETVTSVRGGGPYSIDIGLIQPYWESSSNYADSSFNSYSPYYKSMMESLAAATGGNTYRYTMSNATVDNVAAVMSQCGMVMFDSHGTTDGGSTTNSNSSYLCLTTAVGITSQDTQVIQGSHGSYSHAIRSGSAAYVDGTCIGYHMTQDAPNSYLYMGICLGMGTDGMEAGLRAKGVEVVYGYSQSVTFVGDLAYMQALNGAVKDGEDIATAVANMKQTVGCPDPYGGSLPAYPIVASSEDPYPGQGHVDQAQNVYSTWSLFGTNYTVTATSNNTAWGTVEVRGSNIQAHPAEGYYAAGYTLLSGTATITQNGNVFRVQAESDCSVRINFAAKTPTTVTYYANGSQVGTENTYLGDDVTLPSSAPTEPDYRFIGWTEEVYAETNEKPVYFKPGSSYTVTSANTVLYALYSRRFGNGSYIYELLTEAPDDWEGKYVITSGTDESMYVLKGINGGESYESYNSDGTATFASTGMTLDENELSDVNDIYAFEIAPASGGKFSIRNVSLRSYVANVSGYLKANASFAASSCSWSLTFEESYESMTFENSAGSSYPYMVKGNSYFYMSSSNNHAMQLWKYTEAGELFYYTYLSAHEHELTHVAATAPTCTANGNIEYWRCDLCGKCFSDANAQNEIPAASVVVNATGHTAGQAVTENQVAPTCGQAGGYDTVTYCTVCLVELSRVHTEIPATGDHSYGEWLSNHNGTHVRTCSVCNQTQTENCAYQDQVVEPTHDDQGYTIHTCTVCGYSFNDNYVASLGYDYTIHFAVPEGVEQPADLISNTNVGVNLPSVEGPEGYFFAGWVTDSYNYAEEAPAEVLTGTYIAPQDITLNALFLYYTEYTASFKLLTQAPAAWNGRYVISYGANAAYVMKGLAGGLSYEDKTKGGAAALSSTGIILSNGAMENVDNAYVFVVEGRDDAYALRNAAENSYLTIQNGTLRAADLYTANGCRWMPSVSASGVVTLKNPDAVANRSVLSFTTGTALGTYFRAYNAANKIRLWKEEIEGTPLYTTVIGAAHTHTEGEAVRENEVPATCTAAGSYDLVVYCTECGEELSRETFTLEALGHNWDEGVTTLYPAAEGSTVGEIVYTCSRCRETRTEYILHECPCAAFEDMPAYGTPEHEAIDWAFTQGVTAGMDDSHFGVGVTLNRAQAATFLYAAAGRPEFDENTAENPFTDVPAGKWYTKPVLWAASQGLFSGYSDGSFKPNETLSRGQILVILYAAAGKPSVEGLENPYSDVAAGKWFTNAAIWAYHQGIELGENGLFAQATPCTREAFVLYLFRSQNQE